MILVDNDIKEMVSRGQLIVEGYHSDNVGSVSYDLTIGEIIDENGENCKHYELVPGDIVFVKTSEKISIPNNILGRVTEKNSRMRQGLIVAAPHYQPGHNTYVYARVQNVSRKIIDLTSGMKIAQIMFEQLKGTPEKTYDGTFQNEVSYVGLGNYKDEYESQSRNYVDKKQKELEGITQHIYADVLVLMGIIAAIFSLVSLNFQAFVNTTITSQFIVVMNLSITLCTIVMMGLIQFIIHKGAERKFGCVYAIVVAILIVLTVVFTIIVR